MQPEPDLMSESAYFDRPVQIRPGIYWVGVHEPKRQLQANSYLLLNGDQAVLIDAGSRADFPVVMRKILQLGVAPQQVRALIYQHYDPDLCGSMLSLINICGANNLQIVSSRHNYEFLCHYLPAEHHNLICTTEGMGSQTQLAGLQFQFHPTPYAHSAGSFVTFLPACGTVFTSDLFGRHTNNWQLELTLPEQCHLCPNPANCRRQADEAHSCQLAEIIAYHRNIMPCNRALNHAAAVIAALNPSYIAPQHGSCLTTPADIARVSTCLRQLDKVGIDGVDGIDTV